MKTVTGTVVSTKPISISKAASTLSSFLSADNGASEALCAYLRRASASFNDLKQLHKDLKSSRSDRNHRHHTTDVSNDLEVAVDSLYLIQEGENTRSSGIIVNVVGEVGMKKSGKMKTELVESSDKDNSVVEIEKKKKKHKKKSKKSEKDERDGKSQISANNGKIEATVDLVENNANNVGKDHVESSTKKKRKKKKREEGAIEKEETPVSDSKELKRKEKKRKNRDDDDSKEQQQSTKRRNENC